MFILLKKISFIIVLLGLSFPVHSDHSHRNRFFGKVKHFSQYGHFPKHRHFPKPKSFPQHSQSLFCSPYTSSVCHTYSGNTCISFVKSYHPAWFSTCLRDHFIHMCINLPAFPVPVVQNVCYPIGSPCTCVLGLFNDYNLYDPGMIL